MTRLQALARGLVSLAGLALTLVGVPWVLASYGRSPMTGTPDGGWRQWLTDSAVSDTTVFGVLTAAAWLVWAVFAASVLVELAAGLRGVHAPHIAVAGPLQRAARGLVVGVLLMVSVLHQSGASIASASPPAAPRGLLPVQPAVATLVLDEHPVMPTGDGTGDEADDVASDVSAPIGPGGTVEVVDGDNPWDLATTLLGDGMRWTELWELNQGVPQPDGRAWTETGVIRPGWVLTLPGGPDASAEPSVTVTAPADVAEPAPVVHVVIDDETLSGIAARYLGDPDRWPELFELNRGVEQPDGRRLTDRDLILPGWMITIPGPPPSAAPEPAGPEPAIEVEAGIEGVESDPAGTEATGEPETVDVAPTPTVESNPVTASPSVPVPATVSPTPRSQPVEPRLPPVPASVTTASSDDAADGDRVAVVAAGVGTALVLATGVAVRLRWLRRRRVTRGAQHAAAPVSVIEQAVVTAADVSLVQWAGQHLARMVRLLHPRSVTAAPLAVELSEEAGIEVLWDRPQQAAPPAGWIAADGGAAWRLAYDPDAAVPADGSPAAIPALVTVGVREGRQLLVDLEAVGVLTVAGPDEQAAELVRSIAAELGAGDDLSDAYVSTVDLPGLDRLGSGSRLASTDVVEAGSTLRSNAGSIRAVLDHGRIDDTWLARVASDVPIEATVVVAHRLDTDSVSGLAADVQPRSGVALVATTDAELGGARIVIDADRGTARLEPLGVEFVPARLPVETTDAIGAAIAELAVAPDEPDPAEAHDVLSTALAGLVEQSSAGEPHEDRQPVLVPWTADEPGVNGHATNGHSPHHQHTDDASGHVEVEVGPSASGGSWLDPARFGLVPPGESMLIRVLGVPAIPDRPDIGRRELIVAALLACRGGSVAASAAQDAVWPGKPIEIKTAWNIYGSTRTALGRFSDGELVMPAAERARGLLHLSGRVTTDLALLDAIMTEAEQRSASEAIAMLREGLSLVNGPPFDGNGYDWAFVSQEVAGANTLIEQAAVRLAELAVEAGAHDVAREAITAGLRGLPGNEGLYRRRMRVEALDGNKAGVAAAWHELCAHLAEFDMEPSTATTDLYRELVGSRSGQSVS